MNSVDKHSNLDQSSVRPTRLRKMTEKGREFTLEVRKKAALDYKKEFRRKLLVVEKLITESSDREALQSELQALKNSADKTIQEFVNWLNLAKEPEEINEITNEQHEVQNSWEKIFADASYRLERLELKEEIRSNSSRGSRKSKFSRLSSKSSSSSKSALLGIIARRAVLEQKLFFSDTIKEQEKTLAKLKLQQELSETMAEEAVYAEALTTESEDDSPPRSPRGFVSIIDSFLYDQETICIANDPPLSPVSVPVTQAPVPVPVTQAPVSVPVTQAPVSAHVTQAPVSAPVTQASVSVPATQAPVSVPVTLAPVSVPVTQATMSAPVTQAPVSAPVTQAPVPAPVTQAPFSVPVTQASVSVKQLRYEAQASTPISAFSSPVSQLSVPLTPSSAPVTQSSVLESPVSVSQSAAAGLQSGYVSQIPATSLQSITQQPCVPRSLYGNSPLFVPPQPQLPQVSPTYFLPSSDNTQQINDALTKVTQLQRLPQAKPDVFKGEEKDKTRFFLWETAFDALVDSVPVSSQQKLHLLYQHLEGRAKKVIEQLQFLIGDPERAYTEARKRLKERFGHSAILSAEFEVKLTNWPKVGNSDARGMQEFSDFLQQVEIASEYIPNLKIFEFSSKLQSLVDKLPGWFKTKWSTKVQRLQQSQGHNAFPSFSEFVKEVTFHSERMNIPQMTQMPVINSNHKSTTNTLTTLPRKGTQSSSHQGLATTTLTTQASPIARRSSGTDESKRVFKPLASPDDQRTVSSPKQVFCSYHKTKTHNLDECQKFRDLDFKERKEFLFKNRFCFNCANSNKHIGKNCDQGPPHCKICGNRHATVLHDPSRSEDKVTSTSSACTQVCKGGPIRSCARIVLLKVSSQSDPSKETLTFAVLDDQSTDVFVTDNLLNELSIDGKEVNLQVNTIVGTNTVRTRKVCGLHVKDVNGEHSPVKVCYAYAQESIPATHHDIATPEIARQWEHLKTIADKIPYRPDIEIGMLIGRNIPSACLLL